MNKLLPLNMSYKSIVKLARLWVEAGENLHIELAALEPTLWHDHSYDIVDLVSMLKDINIDGKSPYISLTTNGVLLHKFVDGLKSCNIDKIRISWHTCDKNIFKSISGLDKYDDFKKGVDLAVKAGINISFNRLLLRNYLDDLPIQLDYISRHNLSLKLYDLYWTPKIAEIYKNYYIGAEEVIERYILSHCDKKTEVEDMGGRKRVIYNLKNGGIIQIKKKSQEIYPPVCTNCEHRDCCLEEFGDYLRVDTNLSAYPCYLRRDLGFNIAPYICDDGQNSAIYFSKKLNETLSGISNTKRLQVRLRYVLVSRCNLNCCFPDTNIQWCLKSTGNYQFAKRKI